MQVTRLFIGQVTQWLNLSTYNRFHSTFKGQTRKNGDSIGPFDSIRNPVSATRHHKDNPLPSRADSLQVSISNTLPTNLSCLLLLLSALEDTWKK